MEPLPCPRCGDLCDPSAERCGCGAILADTIPASRLRRPPERGLPTSGWTRAAAGCTCSFEGAHGRRLTLTDRGPIVEILPGMLDEALALDETYRLIAYSTPETIYADVVGLRAPFVSHGQSQSHTSPEVNVLARVGRSEMIHPSLAARTDERALRQQRENRGKRKRARRPR